MARRDPTMTASAASQSVVDLDALDGQSKQLWREALAVMAALNGPWTLVGGLMVQLHAARHRQIDIRVTVDVDILADSRRRPSGTELVGAQLERLGFTPASDHILRGPPTAFRFQRGGLIVDLLAPEHGGKRSPPISVEGFQALEVGGGTQALARSEAVAVQLDGQQAEVRCPNLIGAILMKARAVVRGNRPKDRDDLVVLLACVDNPIALQKEIKPTERRWLRRVKDHVELEEPDLSNRLPADQLERALVAFRLLIAPVERDALR
jgi:hypothetical protein